LKKLHRNRSKPREHYNLDTKGVLQLLKNINPLLSPGLLHVLRAMGHGDELCLVDANFPSEAVAGLREVIRLDGVSMGEAADAIFSVLPLDNFVDRPIIRMEMVDQADNIAEVQVEVLALAQKHYGPEQVMGSLERFAFYEAARRAFAVVATGDRRPYGCFLIKKGVIFA
jgi:L-fucose mutarotase